VNKRIEFVQQQMREEVVHTVNGVAMQMAEMEKRILQEIKPTVCISGRRRSEV
jgi:hypothetical protein